MERLRPAERDAQSEVETRPALVPELQPLVPRPTTHPGGVNTDCVPPTLLPPGEPISPPQTGTPQSRTEASFFESDIPISSRMYPLPGGQEETGKDEQPRIC